MQEPPHAEHRQRGQQDQPDRSEKGTAAAGNGGRAHGGKRFGVTSRMLRPAYGSDVAGSRGNVHAITIPGAPQFHEPLANDLAPPGRCRCAGLHSFALLDSVTSRANHQSPWGAQMRTGGQTTVIKRVLERRAHQPSAVQEDTTATIAVMLRVLPPTRALLAISDAAIRADFERRIPSDMLDVETAINEDQALISLVTEFRSVIMTDGLELIRKIRSQQSARAPYIVYVTPLDEPRERERGLAAGADDSVGRRVSDRELYARIGAARRIAELESVLRIALVENRKLSTTDDLTRVASRRFFSKHFPREVERAARYGRPLSLILCDIDYFKNANDTLGHAGGDEILKQFGGRLQQSLRRGVDWVARIGGEEFAVVLPETSYEHGLDVARKLRAGVANRSFKAHGRDVEITASFGLCGLDRVPVGERKLAEHVLKVADAALYRSKNSGRNRVTATMLPARSR